MMVVAGGALEEGDQEGDLLAVSHLGKLFQDLYLARNL